MLIIIDMQYEFSSAERVVEPVCDAVKQALAARETIVVVEYACDMMWHSHRGDECECRTYDEITELFKDYDKLIRVTKANDDGGKEVIAAVGNFPPIVEVCGVNTDACVRGTVETLAKLIPDTEFVLLLNACNSNYWGKQDDAHRWVDRHRNVRRAA